jgi:hypothetical protein
MATGVHLRDGRITTPMMSGPEAHAFDRAVERHFSAIASPRTAEIPTWRAVLQWSGRGACSSTRVLSSKGYADRHEAQAGIARLVRVLSCCVRPPSAGDSRADGAAGMMPRQQRQIEHIRGVRSGGRND